MSNWLGHRAGVGQADLASLLLTGRRLDAVSGAEAQIVGEQVVGYLSGDLLGATSRMVGLDTIRVGGVDEAFGRRDPAAIASEADPTSRLTFGKNLGDLFGEAAGGGALLVVIRRYGFRSTGGSRELLRRRR